MVFRCLLLLMALLSRAMGHNTNLHYQEEIGNLRMHLYYVNRNHNALDGFCDRTFNDKWCDTYFKICMTSNYSSETCNLYSTTTVTSHDQTFVSFTGEKAFNIPLHSPLPDLVRLNITLFDEDAWSPDDLIADFAVPFRKLPLPNAPEKITLLKNDLGTQNHDVNVTVIWTLKCADDYYGEKCLISCVPKKNSVLACHENGTRICLPGFRGEFCNKTDSCFHQPCVAGGECLNLENGTGYQCICDGSEAERCYAHFNPCVPSPCKNQGQCVRTGEKYDKFICNCQLPWSGRLCSDPRSPCQVAGQKLANADLEELIVIPSNGDFDESSRDNHSSLNRKSTTVCQNGGRCEDLMEEFKFVCICANGWKGKLCTDPDWKNTIILGSVVFGLLALLLFAVIPCVVQIKCRRLRLSPPPPEPFTYLRNKSNYPALELEPFNSLLYNSLIMTSTTDLPLADYNQQPYGYYSAIDSPTVGNDEAHAVATEYYEIPTVEMPPPKLPDRPESLIPLWKYRETSPTLPTILQSTYSSNKTNN